jgi:tRNA-2-methylthio-N6-dimethylallyladenosine synthase
MNERDSEYIAGTLETMGYTSTENMEDADIIFLNTCTIREKAENKALSLLGGLRKNKKNNPDLIIGVAGCLSQQEGKAKKIASSLKHVDIILGTHNLHELSGMLKKVLQKEGQQLNVWDKEGEVFEGMTDSQAYPFKSLINIIYGCNNFCTYCIVPYVRGRERSRKPESIVNEIINKVDNGVKEVMLLGQNVNSYGKDFEDSKYSFADLIRELNNIQGLERIRYMTSHPRDFNDELIKAISESPKVTDHFHLPVQSGSDKILKKMNRGYTKEYYLDLIKKIREIRPNAAITTDIIVGFPGETEKDFQDTVDLVNEVKFASAFSFMYSPRKGTPATEFQEQVPLKEKKDRIHMLNKIINEHELIYNKNLDNVVLSCLIEGKYKGKEKLIGKTSGYRSVIVDGPESLIGEVVDVLITDSSKQLKGKVI